MLLTARIEHFNITLGLVKTNKILYSTYDWRWTFSCLLFARIFYNERTKLWCWHFLNYLASFCDVRRLLNYSGMGFTWNLPYSLPHTKVQSDKNLHFLTGNSHAYPECFLFLLLSFICFFLPLELNFFLPFYGINAFLFNHIM